MRTTGTSSPNISSVSDTFLQSLSKKATAVKSSVPPSEILKVFSINLQRLSSCIISLKAATSEKNSRFPQKVFRFSGKNFTCSARPPLSSCVTPFTDSFGVPRPAVIWSSPSSSTGSWSPAVVRRCLETQISGCRSPWPWCVWPGSLKPQRCWDCPEGEGDVRSCDSDWKPQSQKLF